MKCPRTGKALNPVKVGGVEVDVSQGCGGVWFDAFELKKFTAPSNAMGDVLVDHLKQFHNPLVSSSERLKCPRDTDVVLMRRYYSGKRQIEIDECPQCGGIWLDAEELDGIRELFPKHGDHELAQKQFIDEVMTDPEFKRLEQERSDYFDKLRRLSNILWSMVGGDK